jgi:hypothetical protein
MQQTRSALTSIAAALAADPRCYPDHEHDGKAMIRQFGLDTLDAITAPAKGDHWMQSLVLLYSAIDTVAWACKPDGDTSGSEFCAWVEKYMRPEARLGCTAVDLYAARCAVVHSGRSESRLSRKGCDRPPRTAPF